MLSKGIYRTSNYSLALLLTAALAVASVSRLRADDFGKDLPVVKRIVILGNVSFDDDELKKRMRTKETRFYKFIGKPRYRRDFLRRDIETIRTFYSRNGFFSASVEIESVERNEKSGNVVIRIMINEGPQTTVRSLVFSGQELIAEERLRKGLKLVEGAPYNPNLVDSDRYSLYKKFFEMGYLGTVVTPRTVVDSIDVDVSWGIVPGDPVRVSGISVAGNAAVRDGLIRRELKIHSGEYFKLKKIQESKQNLYDTGYFSSVEIEPKNLDVSDSSVDLLLQVRERKMGFIETGLGVGNVHANRIFIEWGQRNLIGRGYALHLKSNLAFSLFRESPYTFSNMDFRNKYVRHEGELRFPHVFSTWNTFAVGAHYEWDATVEPAVVEAVSFNGTVSRRFSRNTSILLGYVYERVRREEVIDEREKSRRRSLDLNFHRDTRDFYFNPRSGRYIGIEGRYAGGFLGGEDHYYSIVPSFQEYDRLSAGTVLAYRVRAGYAKAFGDSRETGIPIESRFFLGGGNSVRGYEENTLGPIGSTGEPRGGTVMLLTNIELRFPLPWISRYNFGGALFVDGGNVYSSVDAISLGGFRPFIEREDVTDTDYRYSFGFGIRYYTPVGPIRLDFGFPVIRSMDMDYESRVHISLGQIF